MEGEEREAHNSEGETEETEWVDITPQEGDSTSRSESVEDRRPVTGAMRRQRNIISPGRPRGKGSRGYWVAKREEKHKGRTKSNSKPSGADSQ